MHAQQRAPAPLDYAVEATEDVVSRIGRMTLPELRTACRQSGVNPAGSRRSLIDRLVENLSGGQPVLAAAPQHPGGGGRGPSAAPSPGSQNVDNFLGDRSSTRSLAPPGGYSSISFG